MKSTNLARRGGVAVIGVSLIFAVSACGKVSDKAAEKLTEKAIEQSAGGDVDINSEDGSVKVKTEDGSYSYGEGVPEDWPDDVPLPDEFKVTGGASVDSPEGGTSLTVTGTTSKSVTEVVDFYKDKLSGWEKTGEMNSNDGGSQFGSSVFSKDDRQLSVMATSGGESTDVVLSYTTGAAVTGG